MTICGFGRCRFRSLVRLHRRMFDVVGFAGVATGLDKAPRFFAAVLVLIVFNRTRHYNFNRRGGGLIKKCREKNKENCSSFS